MNFKNLAEQNENWIIEQRRYFNAHPELSFEEKNTTGQIGKLLEEMGLTPHYYPDYNGLWAMIEGGKATPESKTVALRADMMHFPLMNTPDLLFAVRIQVSCTPVDTTAILPCFWAESVC